MKSGIPHGLSPSAAAFHGGRTLRNPFGRAAWSTAEHLACVQLPSWPCAHSFRHELAPIEAFQLRIFLYRMHRRFRPQIAQQRVALACSVSLNLVVFPLLCSRGIMPIELVTWLPVAKRLGSPRNTAVAKAVTGPTPGGVNRLRAGGLCRAGACTALSSSCLRFCS